MKNNDKIREHLLKELEKSNKRIAELEKSEIVYKQVEEALKERNENFQLVLSNISTVVWKADIGENGAFENTFSSPVLDELLDLPAGTMKNDWDKYFSYIKPEYLEQVNNAFREAIISPGKQIDCEYEVLKDNGQTAWFQSKGRCFEENRKLHVFGSTINITERKLAEEMLLESEKRFKQIAENALEWIWELDANGLHTYVSPIVEKILGYKPEEIVGKKYFYDLFHPEDREELKKSVFEVFSKKLSFREFPNRNIHKTGKNVWLSTSGVPILDEKGELLGYRGVDTDVTERRQAEEESRYSRELLRTVLDIVPTFICAKNLDGRFILVNKKLTDFYGTTVDKMTGILHADICEDKKELQAMLAVDHEVIESGKPKFIPEETMENPDGSITVLETYKIPFTTHDQPAVLIAATNITKRKQAEESLRESEEKFRLLANNSIDAIWQMDLKLVFTYVSPSVKNIMGYTVEEWVGTRLSKYASTREFFYMARKALYAIKNYKEFKHLTFNVVMLRKDGTEIPVEITTKLLFNQKGLPIGIQGTTRDITERKQAAEELAKHREHLEELVKERTAELEEKNKELKSYNSLFEGRELRIKELRDRVKELEEEVGSR